jgi:biotin synthase-related radical SAM superfamily protein
MMNKRHLPEKVRVSVGSAMVLGLITGRLDAPPTTIYLLTYHEGKCSANCGFCPQARTSTSRADMLSRVTWPAFPTEDVVSRIAFAVEKGVIQRVCIQAINYPTVFNDLLALATNIVARTKVPISVSCQPLNKMQMRKLAEAEVNRVSIALDAATPELFEKIKGASSQSPYTWEKQRKTLEETVQVFGKGSVSTHIIAGLGENEQQIIKTIQWCVDSGVCPSLFAFTPIAGTRLERLPQPSITSYRRIQLARYFIVHEKTRIENMKFDDEGRIVDFGISKQLLRETLKNGNPFQTSGCPSCNRPYYNERPGGLIYNYPRPLSLQEIMEIKEQLKKESNWTFGI